MFDLYKRDLKPEQCGSCAKAPAKLFACSSCHAVKYCDAACQRAHWRRHKKECGGLGKDKAHWESLARDDLEKMSDATGMYILGLRLGVGDGMPRNPALACDLYKAAAQVQKPIPGGHPFAMLHLALHYELGIGVEQTYSQALKWYKSVLSHPDPGEESISPAFAALGRLYRNGLGVEKSEELANKYAAFSQSNPETAAELQHLEQWWESGGREACQEANKGK